MASGLKTTARRSPRKTVQPTRTLVNVPPPASRPFTTQAKLGFAMCLVLAVVTLCVYSPVGRYPFVKYDDQIYVIDNAHIKTGLTWDTFLWAITATDASNWHPLTWLSHALDVQLYGLNAAGHHWTSLLIHIVNVILLYLLLQRVTGAVWKSLFIAALFALHPLNVESVAWIAERKNVLSTMFFLLALGAYGWYARKPDLRRYGLVALLFALGLAAKPMVITLPFVLLLLDFWPLQRIENWTEPSPEFPVQRAPLSRLIMEKLPLLALSAGSAVITIVAQHKSVIPSLALPLGVRIETSLYAYGMYVWKMFWPLHLAAIYPHPGRTLSFWKPLLGALLILGVTATAWVERSKRPYLAAGWLWFLGTAVPIIGIMQVGVQVVADRYAYVPLIGLFVILAWIAFPKEEVFDFRMVPWVGAALIVLAILGFLTRKQLASWQSTEALWIHALDVTSNNSMAESYLANTLLGEGRYEEGMKHLRLYAAMEPLDPNAHAKVAADLQDRGQLSEAAKEFEAAIKAATMLEKHGLTSMDPEMLAITYANLGLTYSELGDAAKAAQSGRMALRTDPQAVNTMLAELDQAVAERPTAAGYVRLGALLQLFGHMEEAQQAFAQAQRLSTGAASTSNSPKVVPGGFR